MIYLGSPFRHRNAAIVQRRIEMNRLFVNHLISTSRALVFAPLLYGPNVVRPGFKISEKFWLEHCLHMLSLAEQLYVYKLDGWDSSRGLTAEIDFARKRGIRIFSFNEFFEPCE